MNRNYDNRQQNNRVDNRDNQYMVNRSQNFNENKYRYLRELNKTEERRYPPTINNIFRNYQNENNNDNNNESNYNNNFLNERRNYNNININNYNFYNTLLDKNFQFRYGIPNNSNNNSNIYKNKYNIEREDNYNDNDKDNNDDIKIMNKSSSFFHPRTMIRTFLLDEEEKKDDNIDSKNEYIYNYRNSNQFNEINKSKISKDNSISPFPINRNNLLKNKFLYNYNNNMNQE